jgi:hypothetical protein
MLLGLVPRTVVAVLAAGVTVLAAAQPTRASVITDSPTLPLLGVPYVITSGPICFASVGVCVAAGGSATLTPPVTSIFDATGQDITSGVTFSGTLTDLANVPIAPISLSGTVEQEVLGRSSDTETGSWTTELASLSLSGPVAGFTIDVALDPANTSTGTTSITPIDPTHFSIDSFFDVFVEITVEGTPPQIATVGPIHVEAARPVPEPSTIAAISSALILMIGIACRRSGRFRTNSVG